MTAQNSTATANGRRRRRRSRLLHDLQTKGYTIIRGALPEAKVERMNTVASFTEEAARARMWPHVRTLPKEFPPWPEWHDPKTLDEPGIWGVQHLMHPRMSGHQEFAEIYFGDEVLGPLREILEVGEEGDERLVMELFNLLVRPDEDFELRWHRDAVPFDGLGLEEEERMLGLETVDDDGDVIVDDEGDTAGDDWESADVDSDTTECLEPPNGDEKTQPQQEIRRKRKIRRPFHAQYNIALEPDDSLILVPGSHLRPRTSEELKVLSDDRYAASLPGMKTVSLEPGDIAFYDNNIIHRGVYDAGTPRLTLHGSVGDVRGGTGRARNVLQHAVGDWIDQCDFSKLEDEKLSKRAEGMKARLIELGRNAGTDGTRALHDG